MTFMKNVMLRIIPIYFLLVSTSLLAQQELSLSPSGYGSVTVPKPMKTTEKIIETAKSWVANYNQTIDHPYEVYDITSDGFKIDGHKPNAFYYRNRGEAFYHRVKYTLDVQLSETTYSIRVSIPEIYTSDVLTELRIADFFAPDGRVKDDYIDAKPSLDKSVN